MIDKRNLEFAANMKPQKLTLLVKLFRERFPWEYGSLTSGQLFFQNLQNSPKFFQGTSSYVE
jgi:hypothetical protein